MVNKNLFYKNELSLFSANNWNNFRKALITGICRSGKTTLGTLIGSAKFVDNIEEPWTPKIVALLYGLEILEKKIAKGMLLNSITELSNDVILYRNQSFKPADLSNVWKQKSNTEILRRLNEINTRDDVQKYIKKNNPLMLFNLTEIQLGLDLFIDTFEDIKIINVIRNGYDVAADVKAKNWFSDNQLIKPIKALPYKIYEYKKKVFYLPWWIKKNEEKKFLEYNVYERGLYYWCQNIKLEEDFFKSISTERYRIVNFKDILTRTNEVLREICEFLSIKPTVKSDQIVKSIISRKNIINEKPACNKELQEKVNYFNNIFKL